MLINFTMEAGAGISCHKLTPVVIACLSLFGKSNG